MQDLHKDEHGKLVVAFSLWPKDESRTSVVMVGFFFTSPCNFGVRKLCSDNGSVRLTYYGRSKQLSFV